MASIYLALRDYVNKRGEQAIQLRVVINRKTIIRNTPFKIKPDLWDEKRARANSKHPNVNSLNKALNKIVDDAQKKYADMISEGQLPTIESMRGSVMSTHDYYDIAKRRIALYGSLGTVARYDAIIAKMKEYSPTLNIEDITTVWLNKYKEWLAVKKSNKPATIHANFKAIHNIWNYAKDMGIVNYADPFEKVKHEKYRHEKKAFLTHTEIDKLGKLIGLKLEHAQARDIFLFSYYASGMRFTDVLTMTPDNIQDDVIVYSSGKTDTNLIVPILPQLKSIIDRNKPLRGTLWGLITEKDKQLLHSQLSRTQGIISKRLLKVMQVAEIKKHISFHCARHTFAQHAADRLGDMRAVQNFMGHSSVQITEDYVSADNSKNREMLGRVFEK